MDKQVPRGWHSRGYLPHFDGGEIPQFVTIRLCDAVPADVIQRWKAELELTESDTALQSLLLHRKLESFADQGHGECWLKNDSVAGLIENALLHFDGQRYRLTAWVVMPNHVHFLFTPLAGHSLSRLMQSLKTYTGQEANKLLQREGRFWMPDYFDRYIRDTKHFDEVVAYIENNPVKVGLCQLSADWRFSSAWHRHHKSAR